VSNPISNHFLRQTIEKREAEIRSLRRRLAAGEEQLRALEKRLEDAEGPVPIILECPSCGERHIDEGEFVTKPHHTHACQECGFVWRPALRASVGVRFLPGFKNP
jgi:predicted RNA-binding Zn-ribbon protein involved in translation (DUF1610 family)